MSQSKDECKNCVHYMQSLIQNPDMSFREAKHGICTIQSKFSADDATPGVPADAQRVGPHELAPKKIVWRDEIIPDCVLRITKA